MKKIVLGIGILLVLLIAAALILPSFVGSELSSAHEKSFAAYGERYEDVTYSEDKGVMTLTIAGEAVDSVWSKFTQSAPPETIEITAEKLNEGWWTSEYRYTINTDDQDITVLEHTYHHGPIPFSVIGDSDAPFALALAVTGNKYELNFVDSDDSYATIEYADEALPTATFISKVSWGGSVSLAIEADEYDGSAKVITSDFIRDFILSWEEFEVSATYDVNDQGFELSSDIAALEISSDDIELLNPEEAGERSRGWGYGWSEDEEETTQSVTIEMLNAELAAEYNRSDNGFEIEIENKAEKFVFHTASALKIKAENTVTELEITQEGDTWEAELEQAADEFAFAPSATICDSDSDYGYRYSYHDDKESWNVSGLSTTLTANKTDAGWVYFESEATAGEVSYGDSYTRLALQNLTSQAKAAPTEAGAVIELADYDEEQSKARMNVSYSAEAEQAAVFNFRRSENEFQEKFVAKDLKFTGKQDNLHAALIVSVLESFAENDPCEYDREQIEATQELIQAAVFTPEFDFSYDFEMASGLTANEGRYDPKMAIKTVSAGLSSRREEGWLFGQAKFDLGTVTIEPPGDEGKIDIKNVNLNFEIQPDQDGAVMELVGYDEEQSKARSSLAFKFGLESVNFPDKFTMNDLSYSLKYNQFHSGVFNALIDGIDAAEKDGMAGKRELKNALSNGLDMLFTSEISLDEKFTLADMGVMIDGYNPIAFDLAGLEYKADADRKTDGWLLGQAKYSLNKFAGDFDGMDIVVDNAVIALGLHAADPGVELDVKGLTPEESKARADFKLLVGVDNVNVSDQIVVKDGKFDIAYENLHPVITQEYFAMYEAMFDQAMAGRGRFDEEEMMMKFLPRILAVTMTPDVSVTLAPSGLTLEDHGTFKAEGFAKLTEDADVQSLFADMDNPNFEAAAAWGLAEYNVSVDKGLLMFASEMIPNFDQYQSILDHLVENQAVTFSNDTYSTKAEFKGMQVLLNGQNAEEVMDKYQGSMGGGMGGGMQGSPGFMPSGDLPERKPDAFYDQQREMMRQANPELSPEQVEEYMLMIFPELAVPAASIDAKEEERQMIQQMFPDMSPEEIDELIESMDN